MSYNIHPLVVHFPIALLFVYSLIKIVPFDKWFPKVAWKDIERVLLVVGVLGAFVALATGDAAKHAFHPNRQLVGMHSNFAVLATFLYALLLGGEILAMINPWIVKKMGKGWFTDLLSFFEKLLTNKIFAKIVAFLALIAISVTGLLGGVMVYGVGADPVAGAVVKMLGLTL